MNDVSRGVGLKGRQWSKADAKRELTAWLSSGLSLAAYARERGIPEKRLSNWKMRLKAKGWEAGMSMVDAGPGLLPVRVVDGPCAGTRSSFEVSLGTGVVVRVPSDFDKGALRRLLEVVSEC
jgi:hypothetical protein